MKGIPSRRQETNSINSSDASLKRGEGDEAVTSDCSWEAAEAGSPEGDDEAGESPTAAAVVDEGDTGDEGVEDETVEEEGGRPWRRELMTALPVSS